MNQKIQEAIETELEIKWAEGYKEAKHYFTRNMKTFRIGGRLLRTTATRGAVRDAIETGTERFDNGEINLESLRERLEARGWFADWECIDDLSFQDIE